MAKKIKIDFTKTEDSSSWNTKQIPEGLHAAKVASVQETEAKDGTDMLLFGFKLKEQKYKTRNFPFYCKLQQNQLWKLRDLLVAAGETVPKRALNIDPNKIVGRDIVIEVEDDTYNGNVRSTVVGTYASSILEDEAPADGEDEDEDEDFLEDGAEDTYDIEEEDLNEGEDEDWLEDEEDEDLEDEEDEDLEDDEELDDEDWEDEDWLEDEEDEEEEPEPVKKPTRRAPAKKAPAKAVAKAPAKRPAARKRPTRK